MSLTSDELARILGRVNRFWPQAPTFSPPQIADWRRTLSKFSFDSVAEAVDEWAGIKPKFRPDLGEILSSVQAIEREKSSEARRVPPFSPPYYFPRDDAAVRAGLIGARLALEKSRAVRAGSDSSTSVEVSKPEVTDDVVGF